MFNIYKITNTVNSKVYIGLTTTGLARRKQHHRYRYIHKTRDHKLYLAFQKYGWNAFLWEVIAFASTLSQLNVLEQVYIDICNSYANGYNMTKGGDSITVETAAKISNTMKGVKHDPRRTEKRKQTIKKLKLYIGDKNPNYGKVGSLSCLSKFYVVTEPDGTEHLVHGLYNWCKNWTKENLDSSSLVKCARGKRLTDKGYKCRYYKERATTIPKGSTLKRVEAESTLRG